ncbi:MAG TPA: DUF998 domain-containing protein [Hymenobacter sp.]
MAAARTDGYSHLTKAVSELGSTDAPHKGLFNWLGYMVPGLLIAWFAYGLSAQFRRKLPFGLLAASGLLLALAGAFPMDMDHRSAAASVLHTVGSVGSGVAWLASASLMSRALRSASYWASVARPLAVVAWTAAPLIVLLPVLLPAAPALGQRIAFVSYFVFVLLLAGRLYGAAQVQGAAHFPTHKPLAEQDANGTSAQG